MRINDFKQRYNWDLTSETGVHNPGDGKYTELFDDFEQFNRTYHYKNFFDICSEHFESMTIPYIRFKHQIPHHSCDYISIFQNLNQPDIDVCMAIPLPYFDDELAVKVMRNNSRLIITKHDWISTNGDWSSEFDFALSSALAEKLPTAEAIALEEHEWELQKKERKAGLDSAVKDIGNRKELVLVWLDLFFNEHVLISPEGESDNTFKSNMFNSRRAFEYLFKKLEAKDRDILKEQAKTSEERRIRRIVESRYR